MYNVYTNQSCFSILSAIIIGKRVVLVVPNVRLTPCGSFENRQNRFYFRLHASPTRSNAVRVRTSRSERFSISVFGPWLSKRKKFPTKVRFSRRSVDRSIFSPPQMLFPENKNIIVKSQNVPRALRRVSKIGSTTDCTRRTPLRALKSDRKLCCRDNGSEKI